MRRCAWLVVLLLVIGCKKKSAPPGVDSVGPLGGDGIAEPGVGSAKQLSFRIDKVYEKQATSAAAPWHEAGGTWTFFDATTSDGARFGFGFDATGVKGGMFAFGKVLLTVPDHDSAVKLTASVAKRFGGKTVPERPVQPLALRPFSAAFLAFDARRSSAGGFEGKGGGYYATKLFLQRPGVEAEVFFNFSIAEQKGEFSEKDADYADDLVVFLASELRDGPRPKRTPETDPSMSAHGPHIEWLRDLAGRPYGMTPERDRFLVKEQVSDGTKLVSCSLSTEGDRKELLRVPHELGTAACGGAVCVAEDVTRAKPTVMSGDDPKTLFVFDTKSGTRAEVTGPWGKQGTLTYGASIAPDGELFLVRHGVPSPGGRMPKEFMLSIVDRAGHAKPPLSLGENWQIVSIQGAAKGHAIVVEKKKAYDDKSPTYVTIDPVTSKISPVDLPPSVPVRGLSPDGKRSVACTGDAIVVTDLTSKTEKRFAIHEDDRASLKETCASWASNRYLLYRAAFIGFVDLDTMKLDEAFVGDESETGNLELDPTFTYVVDTRPTPRVGRIVVD